MKVQITLNDDLVKKIDDYAHAIGMTRSAVCAYWIGQAALGTTTASQILERAGIDVAKALLDEQKSGGSSGE